MRWGRGRQVEWAVGLPGAFLSEDAGYARGPLGLPCAVVAGGCCVPGCLASLPLPPLQPPGPEELPCSSEGSRENLLHQAMQNSGIVLERVPGEERALEPAPPTVSSPQPLGDGPPELPLLEVEQVETVGACAAGVPLLGGWTLGTKSPCYPGRHQPPCCAPCGGKLHHCLQ